ncbi:hypothetical protein FY140_17245 [Agrobacterium tumefaciens]|uniref:hypothetical protein n=1 Tax=Agrobacterium tumefaciens TaxID=358 RepID=UPI0021D18F41|nr:hypothetical protein [Agrobacterium tumefaciens]UXT22468.1 hypothetical protein FY140_17245 [Agrobacterium tumefaciens]
MASIPTFGFSAFLRIICLNEKPKRRAILDRHRPSKDGGYDYHRNLRNKIQKLAVGSHDLKEILTEIAKITKPSERRSTKRGVVAFLRWIKANGGSITFCDPIFIDSPSGLFKIRFDANCVVEINGRRTAIHVWNTQKPKLSRKEVLAALTLVRKNVVTEDDSVDDFAVLSLQDNNIYKWSDAPKSQDSLADYILRQLDQLCSLARSEFELPQIEKRPGGTGLTL